MSAGFRSVQGSLGVAAAEVAMPAPVKETTRRKDRELIELPPQLWYRKRMKKPDTPARPARGSVRENASGSALIRALAVPRPCGDRLRRSAPGATQRRSGGRAGRRRDDALRGAPRQGRARRQRDRDARADRSVPAR